MQLWFPLYKVLHPASGLSSECELDPTIARYPRKEVFCFAINFNGIYSFSLYVYPYCSLEEYMQTSTLGEYKKRLEILMGFCGEFSILKR